MPFYFFKALCRFKRSASYCSCLVRNRLAVGTLRAGIYISDFQILLHIRPRLQHSSHDPAHLGENRFSSGYCNNLPFFDYIADSDFRFYYPVFRSTNETLGRISSYVSRNSCIRNSASFPYYRTESMTSFCLDHTMTVFSRCKSRTYSDHKRSVRNLSSGIFLCNNSINDHIRFIPFSTIRLWINYNRDFAFLHYRFRIFLCLCRYRFHLFYNRPPVIYRP